MRPQQRHGRLLRFASAAMASSAIAVLAAFGAPSPAELNPGASEACTQHASAVDIIFGGANLNNIVDIFLDEGWVWVDPEARFEPGNNHRFRSATGVVRDTHVAAPDSFSNHDSHDLDFVIRLDPEQDYLLSPRSSDDPDDPDHDPDSLSIEWETGIKPGNKKGDGANPTFPKWIWPSDGDRAWVEGHWVYDCGHEEGDLYHTEIHPPRAVAIMRDVAAPLDGTGSTPVPVTLTDVYIHGRGGYGVQQLNCGLGITTGPFGDTCGYPVPPEDESYKTTPIDTLFTFDVCLPPRPPHSAFSTRVEVGPRNTVSIAPDLQPMPAEKACVGDPRFDSGTMMRVTINLEGSGTPPEAVYARRIYAGWVSEPPSILRHRALTLNLMDLHDENDTLPGSDGELSFMWMNVNRAPDAWLRMSDFADGDMAHYDDDGSFGDGEMTFTGATPDFYLRDDHDYRFLSKGQEQDCLDDYFGSHYLDPLVYVYCYVVNLFEEGRNDEMPTGKHTFASGFLGPQGVAGGDDYDLRLNVADVPTTNEDSADLFISTSCTGSGGEVVLVGQPMTCTSPVGNVGPGIPRKALAIQTFIPSAGSAQVDGSSWTVAAPYEIGTQACTTASTEAKCELGTVPFNGTANLTMTATLTSAGLLTERAIVTSASTDSPITNNQAETTIDVFLPIAIDIEPKDSLNIVNMNRNQVTVAVLTTDTFDAASVDVSTVCFGDADAPGERNCAEQHVTGHLQDVNKDHRPDLVLHYELAGTGIDPADTRACLKGRTTGNIGVFGCDAITTQ